MAKIQAVLDEFGDRPIPRIGHPLGRIYAGYNTKARDCKRAREEVT
jgi:hypothetical protein